MIYDIPFESLKGKTLTKIKVVKDDPFSFDEIIFTVSETEIYRMTHLQDCCESVTIDDICGDIQIIVGDPILIAEERSNHEEEKDESCTWTFYEIATIKGSVTIRWFGSSNGYYSEKVYFYRLV